MTNIDRAVKELVADHGYSESRLGGAKPVEHGGGARLRQANYTLELEQETAPGATR